MLLASVVFALSLTCARANGVTNGPVNVNGNPNIYYTQSTAWTTLASKFTGGISNTAVGVNATPFLIGIPDNYQLQIPWWGNASLASTYALAWFNATSEAFSGEAGKFPASSGAMGPLFAYSQSGNQINYAAPFIEGEMMSSIYDYVTTSNFVIQAVSN